MTNLAPKIIASTSTATPPICSSPESSSPTSPIVASATTQIFAAMNPTGSPQPAIFLQGTSEPSTIEFLVDLGKKGETATFSQVQIKDKISQKIHELREKAKDFQNLSSVRTNLCKLSRISSEHFYSLKVEIYDLLISLLENDPVEEYTAHGVLKVIIELNSDLVSSNAQLLAIPIQKKLSRAFGAAVELYLRHDSKDHVSAIREDDKKLLLTTQDGFNDLNSKEISALDFYNQMAIEASKRLKTDNKLYKEVLQRLLHLATAVGKAYDKDFSAFFSEIGTAFDGLEYKLKEQWFEELIMLRELVKNAPDNMKKVTTILVALSSSKAKNYDWKYIYGALEILLDLISKIPNKEVNVLQMVLFGIAPKPNTSPTLKSPTLTTATVNIATAAASATPFLHDIFFFAKFKGYEQKAVQAITEGKKSNKDLPKANETNDKKEHKAIAVKAKEITKLISEKLSETEEGRKCSLDNYNRVHNDKNVANAFEIILKPKPKAKAISSVTPMSQFTASSPTIAKAVTVSIQHSESDSKKTGELFQSKQQEKEKDVKQSQTIIVKPAEPPIQSVVKDFDLMSQFTAASPTIAKVVTASTQHSEYDLKKTNELFQNKQQEPELKKTSVKAFFKSLLGTAVQKVNTPQPQTQSDLNQLHQAVLAGNVESVRVLSANSQLINEKTKSEITPLMLAAKLGKPQICEILLKAGADPLAVDTNRFNILHYAAISKNVETVSLFLKYKNLINGKTNWDLTPLMIAAQFGNRQICEILLKAGADPLAIDTYLQNVLLHAVFSKNEETVSLFLTYKDLINAKQNSGISPLLGALRYNHTKICEVLLKAGADPFAIDKEGYNALQRAIEKRNVTLVTLLSANKQLIEVRGTMQNNPLLEAAQFGYHEICEILLKAGADPLATDDDGYNALHKAAYVGGIETVRVFSTNKQLINAKAKNSTTPLMWAAHKSKDICETLLNAGADPLVTDRKGWNALHHAVSNGPDEIVQFLSTNKKLLNAKTRERKTALMIAAENGRLEACKILLKAGADYSAKDKEGSTALHIAYKASQSISKNDDSIEVVRILSNYKELINAKDNEGKTPFMFNESHSKSAIKVFEILSNAGADLFAIDKNGWNVLHHASSSGAVSIVRKLSSNNQLLDSRTNDQVTPYMLAAENSWLGVCEILSKAGADQLAKDKNGRNVLHRMIAYRSKAFSEEGNFVYKETAVVLSLLKNIQLVNAVNNNGETPLLLLLETFSQKEHNIGLFEELLKATNDPSATDKYGHNVLHKACVKGIPEIVELLSDNQKLINAKTKRQRTPLMLAAVNGYDEFCEILLKQGADHTAKDEDGNNALHIAAYSGKVKAVNVLKTHKQLLEVRNDKGFTPLLKAAGAAKNDSEIAEALVNAGADQFAISDNGSNVLHEAVNAANEKIVRIFSANKKLLNAQTKKEQNTPLMISALKGHSQICSILLESEADPFVTNEKGENALHIAAKEGKDEVVQILSANKKLNDSRTKNKETPFMLAASADKFKVGSKFQTICEILHKEGADIMAVDDKGKNSLHKAVRENSIESVRFLSTLKKMLDSKDNDGNTPLMLALEWFFIEDGIFKTLLNAGADPTITDKNGSNVLHIAVVKRRTEIVRLLSTNKQLINAKDKNQNTPLKLAKGEIAEILTKAGAEL